MLDTSICNNIKVGILDINSKILNFSLYDNIDGGLKLYPMSNYYDDICSTSTTENNIDIPLLERKNDLKNVTLKNCGENCVRNYNINNNSIKCTCFINNKTQNIEDKSEKDKLLENFVEVSKFANLHLLRCYKKVFKLNNLKKIMDFSLIYLYWLHIFYAYYFFVLNFI